MPNELLGRHLAKKYIYSGCEGTKELGAVGFFHLTKQQEETAKEQYNQESWDTE